MVDIVDRQTRSQMMSGIRNRDTVPEMVIRRALHACGYRYRLHDAKFPGKPDMIFPKYKAVIFIHGCFWHGHNCHLFKMPSSRTDFWKGKIEGNRKRDLKVIAELADLGWKSLVIWECAIKGRGRIPLNYIVSVINFWFTNSGENIQIRGN